MNGRILSSAAVGEDRSARPGVRLGFRVNMSVQKKEE